MSQTTSAQRKTAQRNREKLAGFVKVEVMIPREIVTQLKEIAAYFGTDLKTEASGYIRGMNPDYLGSLKRMVENHYPTWVKACEYRRYRAFLHSPGTSFRAGDRSMRYEDWMDAEHAMEAVYAVFRRRDWQDYNVDTFFKRHGELLAKPLAKALPKRRGWQKLRSKRSAASALSPTPIERAH